MKDFLVYHNPDSMQCPVTAVDAKSIVTDKKVHDVEGSRVWLITGGGITTTVSASQLLRRRSSG